VIARQVSGVRRRSDGGLRERVDWPRAALRRVAARRAFHAVHGTALYHHINCQGLGMSLGTGLGAHVEEDPLTVGATQTSGRPGHVAGELPVHRLNMMRVGYLFMGVGLAVVKWPLVIDYDRSMPLFEGVVAVLLTGMSLLAFLGLRYPVRMLPILLFECVWKLIWLAVVALPSVAAGDTDKATQQLIFNCSFVVVIVAVVPWRYVWQRYVTAPGDRWR
jgi:hypothetical protein